MTVLPKSYDVGRFNGRLSLLLPVHNHTSKAVSGVRGHLVFKDQFSRDITGISLPLDEDIPPSSTRSISEYGKDINPCEDSDTKLAVTPLSKMKVTFEPEMVVFADETKMEDHPAKLHDAAAHVDREDDRASANNVLHTKVLANSPVRRRP
jgi:hypothetical protein